MKTGGTSSRFNSSGPLRNLEWGRTMITLDSLKILALLGARSHRHFTTAKRFHRRYPQQKYLQRSNPRRFRSLETLTSARPRRDPLGSY